MSQEIKKTPIVIASILKPVDDTRMFGKLALSITKIDKVAITIIGYPTKNPFRVPAVTSLPFKPFKRISFRRFFARFTFLQQVMAIKPRIIILTTHELLFVSLLAKAITGCRLIYDVQENYYRNIIHSTTFPFLIKHVVALAVRLKEKLIGPAIDHFFLAEKSYPTELRFLPERYTVLENKVRKESIGQCSFNKKSKIDGHTHLIFSGTLATGTGVFEAIRWTKLFYEVDPKIRLTIIGYCSIPTVLKKIKAEVKDCNYISVIGGDELIPHAQILEEISTSDGAFVTYLPNASTSGSIPTKLFEYLACQLPIFLVPHPPWVNYCAPFHASILLDKETSALQLLSNMKDNQLYSQAPQEIYWEGQEASLFSVMDKILSINR